MLALAVAAGQLTETLRGQAVGSVEVAMTASDAGYVGAVVGITPVAATTESTKGDACATALKLAALPGAIIDVVLSAPCHRGQRVVLRHSGLSFTALVGADGQLQLQLPALEATALVATYLDNAQVALGQVEVPDIADMTRFAVHVPAPAQFDLRAATADRVYVSVPGAEGTARVVALGAAQAADPIVAQVYTHPATDASTVDLTLELRITPAICGRTLPVDTWYSQNGKVTRASFTADVPPCGTAGDILVLKNLVPTPTLILAD
ncbi:MAG: hypothetical protein B7Z10_04490 [Rhodobacterales bacterium 32-66-7]|nr:MAG: hypothetical protein B7Z10_04490 [Rhodobacterales bacterium 32-66-7]